MQRRFKIFISSTYTDLVQERLEVAMAVLKLGHIPVGMELFIAGRPSIEIIQNAIRSCDVYVLICGKKYGSIYKGNMSYTDYEYEFAKSLNKQMFSIVQKELKGDIIEDKQIKFRQKILRDQCEFFENIAELTSSLNVCLHQIIENNKHLMNGYLDFSEISDYKNLKNFVFLKDKEVYKKIEPLLSDFSGQFDTVLNNIISTDICESTIELFSEMFNISHIEVFLQENLNNVLSNIIMTIRAISIEKTNSHFINENMDDDVKNIKYDRIKMLNDNIQELRRIIGEQSYYYAMNSNGGGLNV